MFDLLGFEYISFLVESNVVISSIVNKVFANKIPWKQKKTSKIWKIDIIYGVSNNFLIVCENLIRNVHLFYVIAKASKHVTYHDCDIHPYR